MSETSYDSTKDILEHKERVSYWLRRFSNSLLARSEYHDNSKLEEPEKSLFDKWTPNLKRVEFGSEEYKQALEGMGEGLKHHYEHKDNRHHPEHFKNGINAMTLIDVVEMVADWMAAADAKRTHVDLKYLAERFGINAQLIEIIANQLREEDVWNYIEGVPIAELCPPSMRDSRTLEGFEAFDVPDSWRE